MKIMTETEDAVYDGTNDYDIAKAVEEWLLVGVLGQEWLEDDIRVIRESLNKKGIDQFCLWVGYCRSLDWFGLDDYK